ncbi:hypothetical protein CTAYLR_007009 [Chrysophaeum taylorii]|uniref:GTP cyclohydrolase 1 n=1 Tax=Chrysophaeum taylorii TaxID=2483200 RepID=A0AAD7U753_9STRA|nr:hypothetical protein CTAYLR_007009 [Chrysophaeum taylorii]
MDGGSAEEPVAKKLKTPGEGWVQRSGDESGKVSKIAKAVATILEELGEDPTREGLVKTPRRMAELLIECTQGYEQQLGDVINGAVFHEDYREMVIVKDIKIFSLCEHHVVPFHGVCHIAYIPRSKVLGLSKLARISDMYARRLQVQERLTTQIAHAVRDAIQPLGVGVVIEAQHMCMAMRGARQPSSTTITSSVLGCFQSDSRTRAEFFANIGRRPGVA